MNPVPEIATTGGAASMASVCVSLDSAGRTVPKEAVLITAAAAAGV